MANSNENPLNAHLLNPDSNPTYIYICVCVCVCMNVSINIMDMHENYMPCYEC